jgi:hypothetical protein
MDGSTKPLLHAAVLELAAAEGVVLVFAVELSVMAAAFGDTEAEAEAGAAVGTDGRKEDAIGAAAIFLAPQMVGATLVP